MGTATTTACSTSACSRPSIARRWIPWAAALVAGCSMAEPELETHVVDWRDQVIYEVLVDRFADGDLDNDWIGDVGPVAGDLARFQGGDWRGLTERLDYIAGLGATAIWISPVVANVERTDQQDGYHGYWASDFTVPNPRFGDLEELQQLVAEAHRRDMLVIVDVVTNHAGRVFYYDADGDHQLDPGEMEPGFDAGGPRGGAVEWLTPPPRVFRYLDGAEGEAEAIALGADQFHRRGRIENQLDQSQKELGDFPTGLRDLDTERPEVVAAMIDTMVRWVELTDIDGARLDAVPHVPHRFWRDFAAGVRSELAARGKHRFLLLGEVFNSDPEVLAGYTSRGGLDSAFDFTLKRDLIDGVILDGAAPADAVPALETDRSVYAELPQRDGVELSPWQARVAFADNHDMPRLRYWLDDPFAAELAMTVVFTVDAIPAVYYGTEQELDGGWGNASREVMWDTGYRRDTRMYRHIVRLAEIRRQSRALRRGTLTVRYASEVSGRDTAPDAGLLAWERVDGDQRVLVAISSHPIDEARADVPTGFAPGTRLVDQLSGRQLTVAGDGSVALAVPPRGSMILEVAE